MTTNSDLTKPHLAANFTRQGHASGEKTSPEIRAGDLPPRERWQEALILWLRWNDAYEKVTAAMYKAGSKQDELEQLMDQMDELRRQAIVLSRSALNSP